MEKRNIIYGDFNCPRCGEIMDEKIPQDKFLAHKKEFIVRLSCFCGYYIDQIVKKGDFINGEN